MHLEVGDVGLGLDRHAGRLSRRRGDRRPHGRAEIDHRLLRIVGRGDQHRRARRARQLPLALRLLRRTVGRAAPSGAGCAGCAVGGWPAAGACGGAAPAPSDGDGSARWAILAGACVASGAGAAGGLIARSCGFCRMRIAATATESTIPSTTASAAHGHDRRFSTGAEGATGRSPSASGRPTATRSPSSGASTATARLSSASSARVATIGGASADAGDSVWSLGTTAARLEGAAASPRLRGDHRRRGSAAAIGAWRRDLDRRRLQREGVGAGRSRRTGRNGRRRGARSGRRRGRPDGRRSRRARRGRLVGGRGRDRLSGRRPRGVGLARRSGRPRLLGRGRRAPAAPAGDCVFGAGGGAVRLGVRRRDPSGASAGANCASTAAMALSSAVSSRAMSLSGSGGRSDLNCVTSAFRARS